MNYSYGTGSSENFSSNNNSNNNNNNTNNHARMLENYETECYIRTNKLLYEQTTAASADTMINNQFDCLINDAGVNVDTIASENKNEEDILQSSSSSNSSSSSSFSYNMNAQNRFHHHHHHQQHNLLHQHQLHNHHHNQHQMQQQHMHQQNIINQDYSFNSDNMAPSSSNNLNGDYSHANKKCIKQDSGLNESTNYAIEKNFSFSNNESKFQYVLMAPTSPAVKTNEDTLTYLNQGQNYELRLSLTDSIPINNSSLKNCNNFDNQVNQEQSNASFLEDIKPLIINGKSNNICRNEAASSASTSNKFSGNEINDGKTANPIYLSIIRLCFWDRKLQEIEHQEIKEVQKYLTNEL